MPSRSPIDCNRPGCGTRIVFATRKDTGRTVPYEAEPVELAHLPSTGGLHVLVEGTAWNPQQLAEHFQVVFELPSIDNARDLVREYPHHRPHFHLPTEGEPRR